MSRQITCLVALPGILLLVGVTSASAQPMLRVEGTCPGSMQAIAEGTYPEEVVFLYFSPQRGSYTFPPLHHCYGVEVGLNVRRLHYVGSSRADSNGLAIWTGMAGPAACGGYLQAMGRLCDITNVVQIPK